ncbi:hypothetical protein FIBSPDRAFT_215860 [Athelia psychrophila]|uniref:Uncharacterized protein n=1 Tax=Athelia psychrophila TaxID=1759441 RepID=A0A166SE47_9AGAM|nr:hypothetical protein FIBSPDRAFT_215860 [Fibularhizoctonia sp. CBS 109695]
MYANATKRFKNGQGDLTKSLFNHIDITCFCFSICSGAGGGGGGGVFITLLHVYVCVDFISS